ncbi:MAG: ABC transporter substrate-binding protein [Thermovirgaceae bacterium]
MKKVLQRGFLLAAIFGWSLLFFAGGADSGQKNCAGRIVSLAPSVTESLFAMGFGDNVVGVTDFDLFPEDVADLPKVGGYYDPSLEKILALEPDLVIGVETFHAEILDRLESLGIPVLGLVVHRRFNDIHVALDHIARELGEPEAAAEAWRTILDELETVRRKVNRLFEGFPPSVMVVVWHDPLTIAGGYNYIDDIMDVIGLPNAAGDIRYTFPVIDRESLLVRNPDVLVVAAASTGMTFSEKDLKSVLDGLPIKAVEKGRIATVSADSLFHPGPRAAKAADELVNAVRRVTGGDTGPNEEAVYD